MSRLSDHLQLALDSLQMPVAALERQAGLPAMTIAHIMRGSHPRPDRAELLLGALPPQHQADCLLAYILDDCPRRWVGHVEVILADALPAALASDPAAADTSTVSEPATPYTTARKPPSNATLARIVLSSLQSQLDAGDSELADWLATTGELLTRPHLPPEPGR
jgi:hypothetical protein